MAHIHFIACVHLDPLGRERVARALEAEQPDVVTLEKSAEDFKFIQTGQIDQSIELCIARLRKRRLDSSDERVLRDYFKLIDYATVEALKYGKVRGVPIVPVDDAREAYLQRYFSHLMHPMPGVHDMMAKNHRICSSFYSMLESFFAYNGPHFLVGEQERVDRDKEDFCSRDPVSAAMLRELASVHSGKIVHFCGGAHAMRDMQKKTLFSLLEDLRPTRSVLSRY